MIITIKLNCFGVSAFGSLITGGASAFPRAAVGFVHALEKKMNLKNLTLGSSRKVAIGLNQFKLIKGQKNYTSPRIAMSTPWHPTKFNETKPVMDYELKCNSKISLIITSIGGSSSSELLKELNAAVLSMRFNNGSIFLLNEGVFISDGQDADAFAHAIASAKLNAFKFISCRSDLIESGDELNSFINSLSLFDSYYLNDIEKEKPEEEDLLGGDDLISPIEEPDDSDPESTQDDELGIIDKKTRKIKWVKKHAGWIIPVERGYQSITDPITGRPSSRDINVPTIVASPVIGLGEFISGKKLSTKLDLRAFWATETVEKKLFLYSATSFN